MDLRERTIKTGRVVLRTFGIEAKRYTPLAMACDLLARDGSKPTFVQIGANNGTDFDDFFEVVTRNRLPGIVVEPVPQYFKSLQRAYERYPEVTPVRVALHPTERSMPIYTVRPEKAVHTWHHGLASFNRDHVRGHIDVTDCAIQAHDVPCVTFSGLVADHLPGGQVDILAIDTEGFDGEILAMIDWTIHRPKVIRFEQKHLTRADYAALKTKLRGFGYRLSETWEDCTAVQPRLSNRWRYFTEMLKAV